MTHFSQNLKPRSQTLRYIAALLCLTAITLSAHITTTQAESSSTTIQRPSRGFSNLFSPNPTARPFFDSDQRLIASIKNSKQIDIGNDTQDETKDISAGDTKKPEDETRDIPLLGNSVKFPPKFNNIDPNSPDSLKAMVENIQNQDYVKAKENAKEFVGYLQELMFMVREITHLSIEAMVENGEKDEDEVRGVEQLLDWQMATAREKGGLPVRPNQKNSLARIKQPDAEAKAEVYFFFTLNCRFCRNMAPDIERLALAFKNDPRVKITGYVLGRPPKELMSSFMEYTGLQIPVFPGEDVAKSLRLAFLPALIIVSPSNNMSYMRTGQQSYQHMFEFVKTVQGLPNEMTPGQTKIASFTIGQMEELKSGKTQTIRAGSTSNNSYEEKMPVTLAQF